MTGFFNKTGAMKGIEFGLVNVCDSLHGHQIGLVNVITSGESRKFMPIINFAFPE